MEYKLIIYISSLYIQAIDFSNPNYPRHISVHGNIECDVNEITDFYECLLDEYNIDDLSEIDIKVCIVNICSDKKYIDYLYGKFQNVKNVSLWDVKDVLPIILMSQHLSSANSTHVIQVLNQYYEVHVNVNFNFSIREYEFEEATDAVKIDLILFGLLFCFNGSEFVIDDKMKLMEKKAEELTEINELSSKKIKEQEKLIHDLQRQIDSIKIEQERELILIDEYVPKSLNYISAMERDKTNSLTKVIAEALYEAYRWDTIVTIVPTHIGMESIIVKKGMSIFTVVEDRFYVRDNKNVDGYPKVHEIKASRNGKLFYYIRNKTEYSKIKGRPIAVLGNLNDTKSDVDKWMNV